MLFNLQIIIQNSKLAPKMFYLKQHGRYKINGVLETMLWSLLKFLVNILALALVCVTKFINVRSIISKPSILSIKILLTY